MNNKEFKNKLQSIRSVERGITPDPAWVSRTRDILLMQVANSMPVVSLTLGDRLRAAARLVLPARLVALTRGPVLAMMSIFSVALGGSIASVSAAERSLPGDFLYPVKLVTEQTRLALTAGKTDKLKLKTEFVGRRVQEIKNVAASDLSQKPERITQAADIIKQDLDTVKNQLGEANEQGPIAQVAETAKLIDQKSTEFASTLKTVKSSVSSDLRSKVGEAEAAVVNTGVKAVQVLLDSHDKPEAQNVVSNEELLQSIHGKVQGVEDNIADAAQNLLNSSGTSTPDTLTSSSTDAVLKQVSSSSTALTQIITAQESLTQAKQLLSENKLTEGADKLFEAAKAVASIDQNIVATPVSATSTQLLSPSTATDTTALPGVTSTIPVPISSSTTSLAPATTSTLMSTSTDIGPAK